MSNITLDEAMQKYSFLKGMRFEYRNIPLSIELSEVDDKFLEQSLLEENSEAAGHFNVSKYLYVVRGGKLHPVDVKRLTEKIYPPEYLHPYKDYPDDQEGWSETVQEALSRQDLTNVEHIVLYTRGSNSYSIRTNNLFIAQVKDELRK